MLPAVPGDIPQTDAPSGVRVRATTAGTTATSDTFRRVLPRRLVQYREMRRLSQRGLALDSGVSKSTLNSLESGQATDMLVSSLERLGRSLGVTPDALLGYDMSDLVREPERRGVADTTVRIFQIAHGCLTCGKVVPARTLHLQAECMMQLYDHGIEPERIGAKFGLNTGCVECVLNAEQEARRHRHF